MDEAKARLGVMLADSDLIGIPHRIVVGDRGLEKNTVEYKRRKDNDKQDINLNELLNFLQQSITV